MERGSAEQTATQLMSMVSKACDGSMSKCSRRNHHPPTYWWNGEIAELRKRCHCTRRQAQRSRGHENHDILHQQYAIARKDFVRAIKVSKRRMWRELCDMVDMDPWGMPYRTVMAKVKSSALTPPSSPELLESIVSTLFPEVPTTTYPENPTAIDLEDIPSITEEELLKACSRIGDNKAPGPDGIPNVALKAAVRLRLDVFLKTYNACLHEGVFPRQWKQQKLVLLPKGNKPPGEPSSYRPICLLDTAGKLLERILASRLETYTEGARGLSDRQFGFRKARSTVDAIDEVLKTARNAIEGKR